MSYRIISMRGHHDGMSEADEFFHAAEKARESVEKMRRLASEMESRYGERFYGDRGMYGMRHDGYGMREPYPMYDGYGEREMWDDPMIHERRRRDAMGRYM